MDDSVDAEIVVNITVTDINEPPEFEGLYVRVAVEENTPASTNVGDPVLAVDQEMDELTYSLAGPDADLFEVDPSTGQISIGAETLLDFESPSDSNGDNVYELVARVSDGKGEDGEVDTLFDGETGVIISVTNVHEPGDAVSSTVQLGVRENAPANTAVGAPVQTEWPEPAELTYSLDGDDSAWFDISPSSGQITTSVEFDYELPFDANGDNVYEMTVQVTDGTDAEGGADPSVDEKIDAEITVYDINEAPVAAAVFTDRTLVESDGLQQSDISSYFSDPEGDELTYAATSSDSLVAGVGIAGATLAIAPTGPGTATVEVTATDPGQLRFSQRFVLNVVPAQVGSGGFFPIFPPLRQGTGGASGAVTDQANLLSERDVLVVPRAVSLLPGEAVSMHAIAFNLLGDALPAGTAEVVCTWSSDGGGIFMPNGTGRACTTTFTAPPAGSGNIVVRVTQRRIAAVGSAVYEVLAQETVRSGLGSEVTPWLEFPAGVTGSVVWREDGASITTPNGLKMQVPAGAIDADFLGVYVREVPVTDIVLPGNSGFTVGSRAGDFSFVDDAGDPMPGFHTQVPVRICLPITQEDLDAADGGIDGVHIVHVTDDGEYIRHPSDSDLDSMMTCADVDDFSIYFVGLAVEAPEAMATPAPAPVPISTSTPIPAATPTPVHTPTPVPAEDATPILPSAGDARPGARALILIAMVAVAAVAAGVVLLRRTGLATPSR